MVVDYIKKYIKIFFIGRGYFADGYLCFVCGMDGACTAQNYNLLAAKYLSDFIAQVTIPLMQYILQST